MEYVTACYWQKEVSPDTFLALQQRKYHKRRASVVCACISDSAEQVRELLNRMEEELAGEMIWQGKREDDLQGKWMAHLTQQKDSSNYAGILCVEDRVLFFRHGRMRICGCFQRFGRTQWKTMKEACAVGTVEPGTAILAADHAFLNFCEGELESCLRPQIIEAAAWQERERSADRRLKELGAKAERQGGKHMGAVWILPVEGEEGWNRG